MAIEFVQSRLPRYRSIRVKGVTDLRDGQDLTKTRDGLKRWRTPLIVVAVFVALAAYVLLVEMKREPTPEQEPTPTPVPLLDMNTDTVQSLRITNNAASGDSLRTMQIRRARYARQGLWGLVDQRTVRGSEATGRVDARLVAVISEVVDAETETSTGTRSRLIRRVVKAVEATYGPGVVPLPGRATFYKVIDAVATGRHTFGSAVTRRQTANRPQGMFTPLSSGQTGSAEKP